MSLPTPSFSTNMTQFTIPPLSPSNQHALSTSFTHESSCSFSVPISKMREKSWFHQQFALYHFKNKSTTTCNLTGYFANFAFVEASTKKIKTHTYVERKLIWEFTCSIAPDMPKMAAHSSLSSICTEQACYKAEIMAIKNTSVF